MAKAKEDKIQIKSVIDSKIVHNGMVIKPNAILLLDKAIAKELIKKKFCQEVKVQEV